MKKILLILSLGLFLFTPAKAKATCATLEKYGGVSCSPIYTCSDNGATYCCSDSPTECETDTDTGDGDDSSTNTFDCKWNLTSCRTEPAAYADCSDGYEIDSNYCAAITDKNTCKNATGIPCIGATKDTDSAELWCEKDKSINTAIGCIPIGSQDQLMGFILKWAVGIGGGIAFALMLYAGFMLMTAAGNPERMKAGQELLTSAIAGLVLLIFSVFILKFIGVDILGLDKFGFGGS